MNKFEEPGIVRRTEGFSRRDLMRAIGLSTGGMALGLTLFGGSRALGAAASYGGSGLLLELDSGATPLNSAEGGNGVAVVIPDPPTGEEFQRKHTVGVRYEDLVLTVGLASAKALSGWINQTFANAGVAVAKNGALVTTDFAGVEMRRLEFFNAVITEVTLAPLDANEMKTDPFQLTLRISPETTRLVGGSGKTSPKTLGMKAGAGSSFRFNLQGLESATVRTTKISALTAKRGGETGKERQSSGEFRVATKALVPFECSPVSITVPEDDAGPLYAWFDQTVLKGNFGPDAERAGRIEVLGRDLKSVVATVDLGGLGIVRFAPGPVSESHGVAGPAGKRGASVQVDMYCETMSFTVV